MQMSPYGTGILLHRGMIFAYLTRSSQNASAIVNDYMDAYGFYDVSEDYVLEEVLADYYGGIDIFAGTEDAQADFEQRRAAVTRAAREASQNGQTRTEAGTGQEKYSADRRSDRPERRRALRPGEMANEFRDRINWREYYTEIARGEYNPDHFEDGSISVVRLSDGDAIVEMRKNGEWQVVDYRSKESYGRTVSGNETSKIPGERTGNGEIRAGSVRRTGGTGRVSSEKRLGESLYEGDRESNTARDPKASGDGLSAERERKASRDANGGKTSGEKFSMDMDSRGEPLSPQQAEYFRDSKVRDEDGNLLVVYHGTDENFTVFDRTRSRANMDIQGNFFSPWEIDANGYGGNVRAYYLNITNPAPVTERLTVSKGRMAPAPRRESILKTSVMTESITAMRNTLHSVQIRSSLSPTLRRPPTRISGSPGRLTLRPTGARNSRKIQTSILTTFLPLVLPCSLQNCQTLMHCGKKIRCGAKKWWRRALIMPQLTEK